MTYLGLKELSKYRVHVGHNIIELEKINFEKPTKNLELQLNVWKSRNLSLKGCLLLVKTLGISKFLFLAKVIHIPNKIKKKKLTLFYIDLHGMATQTKLVKKKFMAKLSNGDTICMTSMLQTRLPM